jgi:hypothetical protein
MLISNQLFMVFHNRANAVDWLKLRIPTAVLNHQQSLFEFCLWLRYFRKVFLVDVHNAFLSDWPFNRRLIGGFDSRTDNVAVLSLSELRQLLNRFLLFACFPYLKVDVCLRFPGFALPLSVHCQQVTVSLLTDIVFADLMVR